MVLKEVMEIFLKVLVVIKNSLHVLKVLVVSGEVVDVL